MAFLARNEMGTDVWMVSIKPESEARLMGSSQDIHMIRWVQDLNEIWVSGTWGEDGLGIKRLDQEGGGFEPLDPPVELPPGANFGWFGVDQSGRYAAVTDHRREGDIWVIEAQADGGF